MLRPRISTNLAISADGKISSFPPRPSGWTSRADHARLLALRENADALLVGRGTLESDRMTLSVPGRSSQPLRCIVSEKGEFDLGHPLFVKAGGGIHLLVTGAICRTLPSHSTLHHESLADFLKTLACRYDVQHLHCEGGGQLIRALAGLDAIDEFHLTLAGHTIFGGLYASTSTGTPLEFLPNSIDFRLTYFEPRPEEGECFLSYLRHEQGT